MNTRLVKTVIEFEVVRNLKPRTVDRMRRSYKVEYQGFNPDESAYVYCVTDVADSTDVAGMVAIIGEEIADAFLNLYEPSNNRAIRIRRVESSIHLEA